MEQEKLLRDIAPCSLCCGTCPAMKGGVVGETAWKLYHYLEGYYDFYRENLPEQLQSRAEQIKAFTQWLEKFSHPRCNGCRDNTHGKCCIEDCFILECTLEHGVDFCAECKEFPCDRVNTDVYTPTVIQEWKNGNQRIREVGIEQFHGEIMARSHYLPFKKEQK